MPGRWNYQKPQLGQLVCLRSKKFKFKLVMMFFFAMILVLAGCTSEGPTNQEAQEVIEGIYFKDSSIVKKLQCEPSSAMQDEGFNSVWLITYKYKDDKDPNRERHMLLGESDSAEYPWTKAGSQESCP